MKSYKNSVLALREAPSEMAIALASQLGFVAQLAGRSHSHTPYSVAYFQSVVTPAIKQRLIKFYFGSEGQPVGYVIWAFLESDVEERFLETGQWDLHESEWKEGRSLWIVDFLVPFGHLRNVMADLRDNLFKGQNAIRYARTKNEKVICKELSRECVSSFFRKNRR